MRNPPRSPLTRLPFAHKLTGALIGGATALALLAGCSHVPVMSIPALASINFQTTQFSALRAAIEMPDMLVPQPQAVRLNIELAIEDEVAEQRSYALIQTFSAEGTRMHGLSPESGRHAFIYRLSEADQLGMEAIRSAMLAAEQAGQNGSLNLRVSVEDVCARTRLPDDRLLIDVYLMTSETGRFVRTLDGFDLRELGASGIDFEQGLSLCD